LIRFIGEERSIGRPGWSGVIFRCIRHPDDVASGEFEQIKIPIAILVRSISQPFAIRTERRSYIIPDIFGETGQRQVLGRISKKMVIPIIGQGKKESALRRRDRSA
jgi:hypothetical protein